MITQILPCPNCHGTDIVKHGFSPEGKQRYKCRETACDGRTFILDYAYAGQSRHVKQQIVDMATPVACDGKPVFSAGSSTEVECEIQRGFYM